MYKDFALIYDDVMKNLNYDDWYAFMKSKLEEAGFKGTDVLDLGCGTGEILLRLKRDGYKVVGVDNSAEMLLVAKNKFDEREVDIPLVNQDMRKLRLPVEVDLVSAIFDTINYALSEDELLKTFKAVYSHLPEGGLFFFDIATRKLIESMFKNGMFIDDRDDMTIIWHHYYEKRKKLDNIATTFFVKEKKLYRRIDEVHSKKIFSEEEIEETAKKAGFTMAGKYENEELAGERVFYLMKK